MRRLWRWLKARLGSGRRDGGRHDSASPRDCRAVSTLSFACGTAAGSAEGNGDGGPADSQPLHGYGDGYDHDNGEGERGGRGLEERMTWLEERVLRLEEAWRGGGDGVARVDDVEDDGSGGRDWTAAQGGDEHDGLWEGEGTTPQALAAGEVLAKAQELGADTPEGGDGADVTEALPTAVSRGVPQGLPGQQARRKAARLWEGVL